MKDYDDFETEEEYQDYVEGMIDMVYEQEKDRRLGL